MRALTYISICLLGLCLTMPFFGTWVWLHHEKHEVRKEVKRKMILGMDPSELTELRFAEEDLSDLKWYHDKEFEWKGEKYDIVERTAVSDSVFFRCWWDQEESDLARRLDSLVRQMAGDMPVQSKSATLLSDFMKKCSHHPLVIDISIVPFLPTREFLVAPGRDLIPGSAPPAPPPDIV